MRQYFLLIIVLIVIPQQGLAEDKPSPALHSLQISERCFRINKEIEEILSASNFCSVDSDCLRAYAVCGCYQLMNRSVVEKLAAKVKEQGDNCKIACRYLCAAGGDQIDPNEKIECRDRHCFSRKLPSAQ